MHRRFNPLSTNDTSPLFPFPAGCHNAVVDSVENHRHHNNDRHSDHCYHPGLEH